MNILNFLPASASSLVYAVIFALQVDEKTFEEKLKGDLDCITSCWQGTYLSKYLVHPFYTVIHAFRG